MRRNRKIGTVLGVLALILALVGVTVLQAQADPKPKEADQGVVGLQLGF